MTTEPTNCGCVTREAIALKRLRAQHLRFARETNALITQQAAEIRDLREQLSHSRREPQSTSP